MEPNNQYTAMKAYAHNLANRRYALLADDVYDQNFVEIKSTAVEGAHSIYIETWKSLGVVDVESTVPKSGLFYDSWDTRQDLVNGEAGRFDLRLIHITSLLNNGNRLTSETSIFCFKKMLIFLVERK